MDPASRPAASGRLAWLTRWPIWALPRPLRAFVLAVIFTAAVLLGVAAATVHVHAHEVALFLLLLACGAATVELTRRSSEPAGVIKDVYAVWELPAVILLPLVYALATPIIRLALTQWRVRRAPAYRRVFTAAAIGIAYACASLIFRALTTFGPHSRGYLAGHAAVWLLAAATCAVVQWAVNQTLILTAVKATEPDARVRDMVLGKEPLHNDVTELCAAILVALAVTVSALTLIIALPLVTLLQRSFRHAQLLNESRADSKTGLLNAATWEREATAEVARALRTGAPLAVALLDLDRFKAINDTHGHLLGDQVLREIAGALTSVLRDYDLAGRFGGEEFVMLLPQTRAVDAFRIAERVRAHISRLPIYAEDGTERVPVTVSIGVAALDANSRRELPELLAAADAALYSAKASGRDQVQMISTTRGLSAARPAVPDTPAALRPADRSAAQPPGVAAELGTGSTASTSSVAV